MKKTSFKHMRRTWLGTGLCLVLSACNTAPTAVDLRFGDAVKQAQEQQSLHTEPRPCMHCMGHHGQRHPVDTDGVSAQAAVDRYQDSFKSPPIPAPVFNIGLGATSTR